MIRDLDNSALLAISRTKAFDVPLQIGEILKEKFDSAHEVQQKKNRGRRMLLPRFQRFKPHTDTDLVYLKPSSDYCEFDVKKGSLGTHGRECDPVRLVFDSTVLRPLTSTHFH